MGKSAQFPLHTWLPDAMEGPTPVSALIHAATMVTAGVYLIARMHPLFEQAPAAADVGAIGGCLTLIVAATIGLAVTDVKRVIAYSTMSQIGYMIMGVSSGAYAAGLFHLYTHAFFKALLFMAAGSLIAAMAGVQSLDRMSGFRRVLPVLDAQHCVEPAQHRERQDHVTVLAAPVVAAEQVSHRPDLGRHPLVRRSRSHRVLVSRLPTES